MTRSILPASRAFVVQVSGEAKPSLGRFEGRAEHLRSGRVAHFSTHEELIRFLTEILLEEEEAAARAEGEDA